MFELPDRITSLALNTFEFSPATPDEAAAILALPPEALFRRMVADQESEAVLLAARTILDAFLSQAGHDDGDLSAEEIAEQVAAAREELARTLAGIGPEEREVVLRQRAPLALLGGCWLDTLSQPATQPSMIVNRLLTHHFLLKGEGNVQRSAYRVRRRALAEQGVYLPGIDGCDFLARAEARPLTALHGACYLALSHLPGNFLPELVGVHYVVYALGMDDLVIGTPALLAPEELHALLGEYLSLAGPADRHRLRAGIRLALLLEREHVIMLTELAAWHSDLSLDAKVAGIIARHSPYAGRHHGKVRIAGRPLAETFTDPDLDVAAFLADFRDSRAVRPPGERDSGFLRAIKFGGPMFGIFDDKEAAILAAWVDDAQLDEPPKLDHLRNNVGDDRAQEWMDTIAQASPAGVVFATAAPDDERELFYRLVNIENFPNTLPLAKELAMDTLADAEILFTHGAGGLYTDASYFHYSPDALLERVERIYWDKLVDPYQPLEEVPGRDEVIDGQKAFALASMIDGSWAYRIGNVGRFERESDGMLFAIYADEMGRGDLQKNHITLIHQVLPSLGIRLPHIRDKAFLDQDELPDPFYSFSTYQLSLAMFPDSFYAEILGYNLGIELFGLGQVRLHEIQKLRHHGFDPSYEETHLSIDNLSAGHARQSANVIVSYLDGVRSNVGEATVQSEWRRIWKGYASFGYFVEFILLAELDSPVEQ